MDFSSGVGAHHLCCYICATLFVLASFVTRAFSDTPPPDPIRPQLGVSDKLTSEYFNIFKLASEWPVFHFLFSSLFLSDRSKWDFWGGQKIPFLAIFDPQKVPSKAIGDRGLFFSHFWPFWQFFGPFLDIF